MDDFVIMMKFPLKREYLSTHQAVAGWKRSWKPLPGFARLQRFGHPGRRLPTLVCSVNSYIYTETSASGGVSAYPLECKAMVANTR